MSEIVCFKYSIGDKVRFNHTGRNNSRGNRGVITTGEIISLSYSQGGSYNTRTEPIMYGILFRINNRDNNWNSYESQILGFKKG